MALGGNSMPNMFDVERLILKVCYLSNENIDRSIWDLVILRTAGLVIILFSIERILK